MAPSVVARALSCQHGYALIFQELSFTLNSGDVLRITGTNGSGKTSLLKILAGLNSPENGNISLDNHAVNSPEYQQNVFYLGHLPALNLALTALENLEFLTQLHQPVNRESLLKSLQNIGLAGFENEPCAHLSAGQKRRVVLASLFTITAKLWLLDEPFTALDSAGVTLVENCIRTHCEHGGICAFTTHQTCALPRTKILAL